MKKKERDENQQKRFGGRGGIEGSRERVNNGWKKGESQGNDTAEQFFLGVDTFR